MTIVFVHDIIQFVWSDILHIVQCNVGMYRIN